MSRTVIRARMLGVLGVMAALAAVVWVGGGTAVAAEIESSIARGGRLYDAWYIENKAGKPDDPNPVYPKDAKYEKDSWRCKECHGWDYKGKDGAYGSGRRATGIKGIRGAAGKDSAAIAAILRDKNHPYKETMLTERDVTDLANFVSKGQFDADKVIDAPSKKAKGDLAKGEIYYNTLCAGCHGLDGKKVTTGPALGSQAGNPALILHKAYNGQPNEAMPALRSLDPQIGVDLVAYVQTLPQ